MPRKTPQNQKKTCKPLKGEVMTNLIGHCFNLCAVVVTSCVHNLIPPTRSEGDPFWNFYVSKPIRNSHKGTTITCSADHFEGVRCKKSGNPTFFL